MRFRKATQEDIPIIVQMLADDALGQIREDFKMPLPNSYYQAFVNIENDPNQELVVVENELGETIGTLQLSFIQYLTYKGGIRAQIEAVRIHKNHRGEGIGKKFFMWAIERSKQRGAHLLQLTTDKQRPDALLFYESLGFKATHEGMKLHL
ncbi:GNAT family N-acetyltransferase [Spirosoma linguale]|uniref:GCN5-related N-acetyltransferase n=1 Tax=Spirosoma linguale (strain ATCC 33905 / DSM 74 / LMG 10896 / Claus 1) TaxID=504472 RepID=D2QN63_SPILD|nr:GCN5-related N-acetyltransferase [Spirosoma linguale DSM 74]